MCGINLSATLNIYIKKSNKEYCFSKAQRKIIQFYTNPNRSTKNWNFTPPRCLIRGITKIIKICKKKVKHLKTQSTVMRQEFLNKIVT